MTVYRRPRNLFGVNSRDDSLPIQARGDTTAEANQWIGIWLGGEQFSNREDAFPQNKRLSLFEFWHLLDEDTATALVTKTCFDYPFPDLTF